MAYFDKISIDGTSYDVRDTQATSDIEAINNKLSELDEEIENLSEIFDNLSALKSNNVAYPTGTVVRVANGYDWTRSNTGGAICLTLTDAASQTWVATVPTSEEIDVSKTTLDFENADAALNDLVSNGYIRLFFPAGIYYFDSVSLPDSASIRGDGTFNGATTFMPKNDNTAMFVIKGQFTRFEHIYIKGQGFVNSTTNSCQAFQVPTNVNADHIYMQNVHVENMNYGFACRGRTIYSLFSHCVFRGNFSHCFYVAGSDVENTYFNANTFIACSFSDCPGYAFYESTDQHHAMNYNFVSCVFERCAYTFADISPIATTALVVTGQAGFYGCYFEDNDENGTGGDVTVYGTASFYNPVFIRSKNYSVNNNYSGCYTLCQNGSMLNCTKSTILSTTTNSQETLTHTIT